jgi:hypothetical protein
MENSTYIASAIILTLFSANHVFAGGTTAELKQKIAKQPSKGWDYRLKSASV